MPDDGFLMEIDISRPLLLPFPDNPSVHAPFQNPVQGHKCARDLHPVVCSDFDFMKLIVILFSEPGTTLEFLVWIFVFAPEAVPVFRP